MDDDNGEVNPYREVIVNNAEKIEMQKSQMEQWSVLCNSLCGIIMCNIVSLTQWTTP